MPKFGSTQFLANDDGNRLMNVAEFLYYILLTEFLTEGYDSKFGNLQEFVRLKVALREFLNRISTVKEATEFIDIRFTSENVSNGALYCRNEIEGIQERIKNDNMMGPVQIELTQALDTLVKKLDIIIDKKPKDDIKSAFEFFKQFSNARNNKRVKRELRDDLLRWGEEVQEFRHKKRKEEEATQAELANYQLALNMQISNIFQGFKGVVEEIDRDLDLGNPDFRKKLAPQEVERLRIIKIKINDFLDKEKLPEDVRKLKLLPQIIGEFGRELEDVTRRYQEKYQQRFEAGQSALTRLANWIKNIFGKKQVPKPIEVEMVKTKTIIEGALGTVKAEIKKFKEFEAKKPGKKKPEA